MSSNPSRANQSQTNQHQFNQTQENQTQENQTQANQSGSKQSSINYSSNNPSGTRWERPEADGYAGSIARKIPGYGWMYHMMDCFFTEWLSEREAARLLIVGAGGGQEIAVLGEAHKEWAFTGVDPSARMLDLAKKRVCGTELEHRTTLLQGTVGELPDRELYDAGSCMLALHFVPGLAEKRQLLRDIAARLRPGAPFVLASICGEPGSSAFELQMQCWRRHMLQEGIPEEDWERFAASFGQDSHPIPVEQVVALLEEAGFSVVTRYFGSFLVEGLLAIRSAD